MSQPNQKHLPLLARQPIFDTEMNVYAYELLCRDSDENRANISCGDQASSQVLLRAFTDLSIGEVVGEYKAFINFTRNLLLSTPPFSRTQLVIEVLEDQIVDNHLLASLGQIRAQGYTIALDDFTLTSSSFKMLEYADIVKLDVLALSEAELQHHVEYLKPLGVTLLAEKIETYEMLEHCKSLGFRLFQGYFLSRPQIMSGRKVSENRQTILQLLAQLNDPGTDIQAIEHLIAQDPVLSYKMLKLINSAAFHFVCKIESLRQAITLLGLIQVRSWITLLSMASIDDKPRELCVATLVRARFCQTLGEAATTSKRGDTFFTVGLLSTIDAFMDAPMEELLQRISISENIRSALMYYKNNEGKVLEIIKQYEKADWDNIDWSWLQHHGVEASALGHFYTESLVWVTSALESLVFDG
ncbi:HDOD domain-containing protein [Simiduia sp. 21SJ11W-1]|uniref:EAL and HDOD domain-containing protein n=1 Tax=Simiduia sp. 21SJ11W-1 TaxID=2909669 RepID=UPI0020A1B251|nr:HDOD domain-containing protein [Simiduia sp. 21SJ11W-1]UTA49375.1 HDOD domain-containing protein [Simiduia sp. 21SJ11W-1]